MRIAAPFILIAALPLGACNEDTSDLAYAAWGTGTMPRTDTIDVHDRDGALARTQHVTVTPKPPEECKITATLTVDTFDPNTGKNTPIAPADVTIDFHKATSISFEWQPLPAEAQYFADPAHKPSWTPRNYLITRIQGQDAVCQQGSTCQRPTEPVAVIADTAVTPELMLAAFNRVKTKCPTL